MIARQDSPIDRVDLWASLAAPVSPDAIAWRQDGRTINRDGRSLARFVAYIEAGTVRERLDSVVPGEWDLTLELLPSMPVVDDDATQGAYAFKARLQILGVIREDVGTGKDYKQAATDAFKRAAVRFGIGHELYAFEQNWVEMDSDGKFARPVEDPAHAYARRAERALHVTEIGGDGTLDTDRASARSYGPLALSELSCPKCGGRMWDNRLTKRNPKAPDYKCRDRSCDGVVWPEKQTDGSPDDRMSVTAS